MPDRETAEGGTWRKIDGIWKRLFGSFPDDGRSVEWHDFAVGARLDWAASYHRNSLEICLNFGGRGVFGSGRGAKILEVAQCAIYTTGQERLAAFREAGARHRFLTIELAPEFLERELARFSNELIPEVQRFLRGRPRAGLQIAPMSPAVLALRRQMLEPPVPTAARSLWVDAKINEILARYIFCPGEPTELFCEKVRRLNRERCDRILFLLERDMENPPSLEMLAADVGCSPFHLSRIYAEEMGTSIPATLRRLRVERAANLLREGQSSVTDAAFAVGYSSLGAFYKAFAEHFRQSPRSIKKTS